MAEREAEREGTTSQEQTGGPAAGEAAADENDALRKELEEVRSKGQEYLQLLQRVQADFVNYRRRTEQEYLEQARQGKAEVILRLLPALDDFERAMKTIPEECKDTTWTQGVALIERKLRTALESQGLTRIEAQGKQFNPWEHEAVLHAPAEEGEAEKVVEVLREGYRLDGRVIRPAQVKVGRAS